MSGWSGFSDAELRRLQQKDSASARGRKPTPATRSRQQLQRERALQLAESPGLPPEQKLTKPPPQDEPQPASPVVKLEVQQKSSEGKAATEEESPAVKELEKQEVELREKTRLEQLQQEQKMIEERNKRKKALLTKTIAEKSKQTQAEAVKLKRIQKELQALDDMVSNDIGILRGKIEQASWEYSTARKRYEKAETEYVMAKLDLHRKTEVKEQLTEHLCAIIQQNELRKAHKLEELLQQLQLQATEEELEELEKQQKKEEEEEEEEKRKSVEAQRCGKEENGVLENQGGTVQSTKDCRSLKEETEEERGGGVQQEQHAVTEQDCKTLETRLQCETVAS
ncbi:hypothetical protein PAMA_001051 [Pampus argenteus]